MAQTPLSEAYRVSGSGFDKKISALVGIGQSIKQSQVAKQKFQQQLDLVEARSEATFQRQKRYQEEVIAPREQKEAQNQLIRDRAEAIQDSLNQAEEARKELQEKRTQDRYQNLARYNLDDFHYGVESITDESGTIQAFEPSVFYGQGENAQRIDYGTYTRLLTESKDFADWLDTLSDTTITNRPTENDTQYISPEEKDQYIKSIKTDPTFRQNQLNLFNEGKIGFQPAEADGSADGGSGRMTSQTPSIPQLGIMKEEFADYRTKDYSWSEDVSSLFGGEVAGGFTIDYTNSVSAVKSQIDKAISKGMLPDDFDFSLDRMTPSQIEMLAQGQVPENLPEDLKSGAERLLSYERESTKQTIQELLNNYSRWNKMYYEYSNTSRQALPPDEVVLDIWGAPSDLENLNDYKQIFKPIDKVQSRDQLLNYDKTIRREADLIGRWWSDYGDILTPEQ